MSPPATAADRYASEVVRELMAMGWSRARAIGAVQGEERYVRQQFSRGTPPAFSASVLGRKVRKARGQEIVGLAKGSTAFAGGGKGIAGLSTGTVGAGTSRRSGGQCVPFLPPLWVSPEVGDALEHATASPPVRGTGHAFGRRGGTKQAGTKQMRMGVLPGVVVSKAGTSWTKGGAKYVSSSTNGKIGAVDTTWVSIARTCVDCSFLEAKVCYALGGNAKYTVYDLDKASVGENATEVAQDEADCIDSSYSGSRIPQGRVLRVHSSGDTSTPAGAKLMAGAIERWYARGGTIAYTYTHAWRRVPRSDFGRLSTLASLNPGDDARDAMAMGYKAITALAPIDVWASKVLLSPDGRMTFKPPKNPLGDASGGLTFIPCPAQYPYDEGAAGHESWRWKMELLAKKIGVAAGDIEAFVKRFNTKMGFVEDKDSKQYGWPITEGHKHFAKISAAIVASGLPDPLSDDFRRMFRAIPESEKITCDKCKLCHDDVALGARRRAILFRGDFSGGIIKTESLLRKQAEQRVAEIVAAAE